MRPELLLRLYPRAWRERYGEELLALVEAQRPSGLGAWLDLLRGALVAHLHPLAADRDAAGSSMMIARPAIALRLTMWLPLLAVFITAVIVLFNFDAGRPREDWRVWLPPSLLQDLIRSPFSSISPTSAEAQALEHPRVLYFTSKGDGPLKDLAVHLELLAIAFLAALMWALMLVVVARWRTSRSRPL